MLHQARHVTGPESQSAVYLLPHRTFLQNSEVEVTLTLTSDDAGGLVSSVTQPSARSAFGGTTRPWSSRRSTRASHLAKQIREQASTASPT